MVKSCRKATIESVLESRIQLKYLQVRVLWQLLEYDNELIMSRTSDIQHVSGLSVHLLIILKKVTMLQRQCETDRLAALRLGGGKMLLASHRFPVALIFAWCLSES